jgi:putative FmdB family regulatory protein
MPLYEYRCGSCNQVFEVMQKFSDEPLTVHESCGGALERLISTPSFHFKGSGWYVTDYARSGGGSAAKSGDTNGESGGKAGTKSDAKADSSPAPKPAAKTD